MSHEHVRQRTLRWLEEAIIGLQFCPFAAPVFRDSRIHIAVTDVQTFDDAIRAVLTELDTLLSMTSTERATTLVVLPQALASFDEYLDAIDLLDGLLDDSGVRGILQLASFHPHYCFANTPHDAIDNMTNRSPYPIVHILREDDVSDAVDQHPDTEQIPRRNIARLRQMGWDDVNALWARWQPPTVNGIDVTSPSDDADITRD